MTRSVKVSIVLIAVFAVALASFVFWSSSNSDAAAAAEDAAGDPAAVAVRENSHRLSDPPESRATVVEFLDVECEACRAAYPAVEQLRETYGDMVTFVVRYFPIPSHANAERAARAVEAAAQQGRFEAMYQRMYETQAQWGEQQAPMDNLFREFAAGLGLDGLRAMAAPAFADVPDRMAATDGRSTSASTITRSSTTSQPTAMRP